MKKIFTGERLEKWAGYALVVAIIAASAYVVVDALIQVKMH